MPAPTARVLAYVIREREGRTQLLVFDQLGDPAAGPQVPAGPLDHATRMKALATAVTVGTLALAGSTAGPPRLAGCPAFPADNPWNQRVDRLPVARGSAAIVDSIGADTGLHPDFGAGLWDGAPVGIPVTTVRAGVPRSRVAFDYPDESDRGPYPIPADVKIEGGGDRHALIVDSSTCTLYELYALRRRGGAWHAGSGAIWSLRSNRLRPAGWTSADAVEGCRSAQPGPRPTGARSLAGHIDHACVTAAHARA